MKKFFSRIWCNSISYISLIVFGVIITFLVFLLTTNLECINNSYIEDVLVGATASIVASIIFLMADSYKNYNKTCESVIYKVTSLLISVDFYDKKDILLSDCFKAKEKFNITYKYLCGLNAKQRYNKKFGSIAKDLFEIIEMFNNGSKDTLCSVKSILEKLANTIENI